MNTFWLTGKEGGIPRSVEMTTPGYMREAALRPEYLTDIFGGTSEEEVVDMEEPIMAPISLIPTPSVPPILPKSQYHETSFLKHTF